MINIESLTDNAAEMLKADEGLRLRPYRDTEDFLTIGYGWCLDKSPMRKSEADFRLSNDIAEAIADLIRSLPWFSKLDEVRQMVFVGLRHNLGMAGLLMFKRMLAASGVGNWDLAATELLDSMAAEQLPTRYHRFARMLTSGERGA